MSVKPVRQIESRVKRKKKKGWGVGFDGGEREREREGDSLPYTRLAALFPDDLAPSSLPCPVVALVEGKLEELWKRSQTAAEFAPLEANRVVRLCPADSRFFNFPVYFFESCSFDVFTVFTLLSLFLSLDTREAVCLSCNVE